MLQKLQPSTLFLALLAVQLIDVLVHIATGQPELIRMLASALLVLGAIAATRSRRYYMVILIAAGAAYLLLNFLFVSENGVTNPANGNLRIPLLVFVVVSLLLEDLLRLRLRQQNQ